MNNMENILDKIEKIKTELNDLQQKLESKKIQETDKQDLVTTVVNGKGKIIDFKFKNITIDENVKKALINSVNNALDKAKVLEKESKQKIVEEVDVPDVPGLF